MFRDTNASMAVQFALLLLPITVAMGVAVEVSRVENAKARLQGAIDAAALAALAESTPASRRTEVAKSVFAANLSAEIKATSPSFGITISGTSASPVAKTSFKANVPLAFGALLGQETIEIDGTASAGMSTGGDVDIDLWLDSSGSMAIAATAQGRVQLENLIQCAFACHLDTNKWSKARAAKIPLRIDVMKTSVATLIDSLSGEDASGQSVRFRISSLSDAFRTRQDWTNATTAKAVVQNFTLSPSKDSAESQLSPSIATGTDTLPWSAGDGYGSGARHIVVIVTDGMQYKDDPGPIDTTKCDAIKKRGVTVAVVWLRYVDMSGDDKFDKRVKPYFNLLQPALFKCASEGMYFEGDTPVQIEQAFAGLAGRLRGQLRLTR